jgi:Flp pilus assembly protein CpaB
VGRRTSRSAQRAVIGGLLVAAAAVVVFAVALSAAGGRRTSYVVGARPLAAGAVIGPGDTTTARLQLTGPAAAAAYRASGQLIGRTVAVAVAPGQLIEPSMLAGPPGAPSRPVSISVDSDSVSAVAPGQSVDVLSTPGTGSSAAAVNVVMRGATVLSLGRTDTGLLSGASSGSVVATLGVSDLQEAEQLVQAAHAGTVELVQAEPGDGRGLGPGSGG